MKNLYSITFFLITIFLGAQISSYKLDSLEKKSYEELTNEFNQARTNQDTVLAKKIALKYINKGKTENIIPKQAYGYILYSRTFNHKDALLYIDTAIILSEHSKHKKYPTLAYLNKGYVNFKLGHYKQSLENFLKANEYADKKNHIEYQIAAKEGIAVIRKSWGDYKEAIKIYKAILPKETQIKHRLSMMRNLAISFLGNNEIDSAIFYTKAGINESLKIKDSLQYSSFLLTHGSALYAKNKIDESLDTINKCLLNLADNHLSFAYFYKAKILQKRNDKINAIKYLLMIDSIYSLKKDEFPELLETYSLLSNYYKKKGNKHKQLLYLEKLVKVDSIIYDNYDYIESSIQNNYDIPILKKEKETLINQIENERENSKVYKFILFGVSIFSLIIISWYYKKQNTYKKKFEVLVNKTQEEKEEEKIRSIENDKKELAVPDEIASAIMEQLNSFEQNKGFLQRDITLQSLANNFNTNSSYLSKVINHFKGKNFAAYLNKLRIDESVRRLKEDAQFRKFTIQAIAHESGFKSSQSFSRAFFKETGIYPSYFLKGLKSNKL